MMLHNNAKYLPVTQITRGKRVIENEQKSVHARNTQFIRSKQTKRNIAEREI